MARFLGQLFEYTAVYDMQTRPELILLQKNLVIAEGVARSLNPELNLWRAAEPVVKEWLTARLGPRAKIEKVANSLKAIDITLDELPTHLGNFAQNSETLTRLTAAMEGMDDNQLQALLTNRQQTAPGTRLAMWIAALSLAAIAINQLL